MTSHTWAEGRGIAMLNLTDGARRCLDIYLAEVRSSLRHCRSVDVADVERDVVEHIEHALGGAVLAVDERQLRDVLRGLGSPAQWVPQEELGDGIGWLRRIGMALRSGPEDLRLGYLAFGLWCVSAFLVVWSFSLGGRLVSVLPFVLLGLVASFVLGRAAIAVPSGLSKAERWLVYPSLVSVYGIGWIVILVSPLVLGILVEEWLHHGAGVPEHIRFWFRSNQLAVIFHFFVTFVALEWAIFGFIAWRRPQMVRDGFAPFMERFRRRSLWLVVSVLCTILFGLYLWMWTARFMGLSAMGIPRAPVATPAPGSRG